MKNIRARAGEMVAGKIFSRNFDVSFGILTERFLNMMLLVKMIKAERL